jgi:hypothetical protein
LRAMTRTRQNQHQQPHLRCHANRGRSRPRYRPYAPARQHPTRRLQRSRVRSPISSNSTLTALSRGLPQSLREQHRCAWQNPALSCCHNPRLGVCYRQPRSSAGRCALDQRARWWRQTRLPWGRVVRWCCHGCGRLRSRGLFVSGRGS